MKKLLKKIFHIPGPRELGWSKSNALGSKMFTPFQSGPTWDDWRAYVKKKYPVRYFFSETFLNVFHSFAGKIRRLWYWLKCHLLSKYQYHKIDLRGVDPLSGYTHGWLDPATVMELSAWLALKMHMDDDPIDPTIWAASGGLSEEGLRNQKANYDEAIELYNWWTKGRAEEEAHEKDLYEVVRIARESGNKELYETSSKKWIDFNGWREEHAEKQFLRLAKLRPHLYD